MKMKENQKREYEVPKTTVFEMQFDMHVLRQNHQHDDESEWES